MNKKICLLALVFCCNHIFGQFKNLKFENLSTAEGLSSSTCLEVFQDRQGFLWFGTIDGLNKYNGYEFKIYRPVLNDSTSISNNRINVIQEDKQGNLWIGTNNGLNFFDRKTECFKHVKLYEGFSGSNESKKIISLLYDEKKNQLWVGTGDGLVKLILKKDTRDLKGLNKTHYESIVSDVNTLDNGNVNAIVKDKEGFVWLVTNGQHLNRYNAEKDDFDRFLIQSEKPYELNHLPKRIYVDSNNHFWIGNDASNVILWDKKANTFEHVSLTKESVPFYTFYEDSSEKLWVVTDGAGILVYNRENKKIHHIQKKSSDLFSLPGNQISDVIEARDGVFWLGTYNNGVIKLDMKKSSFGHYYYQEGRGNGLDAKIVQSVLQDSKGRIWLGAYNGGLNLFDEKTNSFKSYGHDAENNTSLSSNKILYTFEASNGCVWVCTLDGGLNKFNPENKKFKRFYHDQLEESSLGQNSVWTGVEDKQGRVWLGLRNEGVDILDSKKSEFHHFKIGGNKQSGLLSNSIFFMFIDSSKRLLVGTSLGLNYVNLNELEGGIVPEKINFNNVDVEGVLGNQINHITEDYLHNIWLGTDIGVYKLDANLNLVKSYFTQDGLPNNLITGIQEDLDHNLWITTRSGLSFLNPETDQFKNFNTQDGIQGMEYQSKSIERTQDGKILIGGINGFNIFDPQDISITSWAILKSKITGLKVNNEYVHVGEEINSDFTLTAPVSEIKSMVLDYDQANLTFDFISLYFQNQDQVRYAYKMEGLNEDYVEAGKNRTVNYSNLQPGEYVFSIKSSINDDWDLAPVSSVRIKLNSPPWKTWWAYTFYVIVGFVFLWYAQKYYTKRINRVQEREFDQMKLEFFINVSHEFRTPLTLILNPLEKLITGYPNPETVKTSALSIQRSARRLLYLVNQLLDYRKMEVGMAPLQLQKGDIIKFTNDIYSLFKDVTDKKEIVYSFESKSNQLNSFFDVDKIEKILTNLISNAIKFTDSGQAIKVIVDKKTKGDASLGKFPKEKTKLKEYIEIVVEDTGIGMEKEHVGKIFSRFYNVDANKTGTGIGLNFTKGLVEIHGGEIFVESEYQKGSTFVVRIPYYKTAKSSEVINVKDEFLINSMKSVEYDMLISDATQKAATIEEDTENDKKLPKLLVVEDNKELREHLKNELKPFYKILEAVNGEEGLAKVTKYYPDVVVSDVMMPKMDGFELCRRIKSEFETCHIPVVLLTARALGEDRIEGYKTGADGYLGKPFNINVLKARIDNLLEAKRVIREKFSKLGAVITPDEVTSNSIDEAFIEKTTKVILDHISDTDFKMEHLLKEIGIGRSQFYRKIQSITGQNPSNFIRTIRLKYASDLLIKDVYTIKEVTHMAGFNSAAYFGKTFRELYGMTPSEYIEQSKNKEKE